MENVNLPEDSRWTVLKRVDNYIYPSTGKTSIRYLCRCLCGKEKIVHKSHIQTGSSKSCGCLNREISSTVGGLTNRYKREYSCWMAMKARCSTTKQRSEKNSKYENISICQRWLDSFINFIEDMGECPRKFELERVDSSLGYFPENCMWASELRQSQNKGDYKNNTSGQKGVTWSKEHSKWRVYLYRDKKRIEGGLHDTLESAIAKRKELEIENPMQEK